MLENLVKDFKIEYIKDTNTINLNTIYEIMKMSVKLSEHDFNKFAIENRI